MTNLRPDLYKNRLKRRVPQTGRSDLRGKIGVGRCRSEGVWSEKTGDGKGVGCAGL